MGCLSHVALHNIKCSIYAHAMKKNDMTWHYSMCQWPKEPKVAGRKKQMRGTPTPARTHTSLRNPPRAAHFGGPPQMHGFMWVWGFLPVFLVRSYHKKVRVFHGAGPCLDRKLNPGAGYLKHAPITTPIASVLEKYCVSV
jgi:hypothetical protein